MTKAQEALDQRSHRLFEALVPDEGKAATIEGEHLRAINRIIYRWYNDGDYFYKGYGCETAGPAHAYLVRRDPMGPQVQPIFKKAEWAEEDAYNDCLYQALEIIVDYIEARNGEYRANTEDMLRSTPLFEEETEEEDEDDGWPCDDDDNDEEE